jgi:REP element-mobilizing transposase RayT
MFETRADVRAFLAALACRVRAGELEVHAYCVLSTHYHLLVRSPGGTLSAAMHRIQLAYSRRFNRGRGRDGTLVRSRFRSKRVRSAEYRRTLVAYIDDNPVEAGLVLRPQDYPHASARHHRAVAGPPWLSRGWIESELALPLGSASERASAYDRAFGRRPTVAERAVVEARIHGGDEPDALDDLLRCSPQQVQRWLRRRALLADGTRPGLPVSDLDSVLAAIAGAGSAPGDEPSSARLLRVGLGRELSATTLGALGRRLGCAESTVHRLLREHRRRLVADPAYARHAAAITQEVLADWRRARPGPCRLEPSPP